MVQHHPDHQLAIPPDELARAKAEMDVAEFIAGVFGNPRYWHDFGLIETDIENYNKWAAEWPELAMCQRFMHWPRWMEGAKAYVETVVGGLAEVHLRVDTSVPAIQAVAAFRAECDAVRKYVWESHFEFLAHWFNSAFLAAWQAKLPDFAIREIDYEHFETGMIGWQATDRYRPAELEEDCIDRFWGARAIADGTHVIAEATLRTALPQFSRRKAWLQEKLIERGWSTSDPYRQRGPDRKTVEKILRGEPVRNDVLEKLAEALSRKGPKVNVLDIPRN